MSYDPEAAAKSRLRSTLKGKWRLDSLLGIGGMAAVYAATHRNGNRVAIKMLHPHLSAERDIRQRFLREGYVANAVGHPGAVRVIDDDETDEGAAFLVMELLEGETLEARMSRREGQLPPDEVLLSAGHLLGILHAAHSHGVLHRDIKPENVFLTRAGDIKILDFGIARLLDSSSGNRTGTGVTMGTPAFMPPEQAMGKSSQIDARTDLWAVGAMMFTLLLGRHVHAGETANQQLILAATTPAPRVHSLWPTCPPSLAHIIDRALEFESSQRWSSAAEMLAAIEKAMHRLPSEMLHTVPLDDDNPTQMMTSPLEASGASLKQDSESDDSPTQMMTSPLEALRASLKQDSSGPSSQDDDPTRMMTSPLEARPRPNKQDSFGPSSRDALPAVQTRQTPIPPPPMRSARTSLFGGAVALAAVLCGILLLTTRPPEREQAQVAGAPAQPLPSASNLVIANSLPPVLLVSAPEPGQAPPSASVTSVNQLPLAEPSRSRTKAVASTDPAKPVAAPKAPAEPNQPAAKPKNDFFNTPY